MYVMTHTQLGEMIYQYLSTTPEGAAALDMRMFKRGNYLPDVSRRHRNWPGHYYEEAWTRIKAQITQLSQTPITGKDRVYSRQLGVVCHYLCDFFCYAHQKNFPRHAMMRHMNYERRVHRMAMQLRVRGWMQTVRTRATRRQITKQPTLGSVFARIEALHSEYAKMLHRRAKGPWAYMRSLQAPANDVMYALQVCCEMAEAVMLLSAQAQRQPSGLEMQAAI